MVVTECWVHAGHLLLSFLISTPVFCVGSTPLLAPQIAPGYLQTGEWVGWCASWNCPFLIGDMDRPLSNWGYGLARFWLGILGPLFLFVMELSIGDIVFYTSRDNRDS